MPLEQKEGGPKWIVKVCEHIGLDNCLHSLKIFTWINRRHARTKDREIAPLLGVSRSKVQKDRKALLQELKNRMGE